MTKFRVSPRTNYMSLADMAQDLTTEYLINKAVNSDSIKESKALLCELEGRIDSDLTEDQYFDVLDKCNPTY